MFIALFAAAPLERPAEPLVGQFNAAIWYDLDLNAVIGNYNWIASLWYNAGAESGSKPDLHIQDLKCGKDKASYRCSFTLFRDGGVKTVMGEKAPDRLRCRAELIWQNDKDGWMVRHLPPPPPGGHSRTSMRCRAAPS